MTSTSFDLFNADAATTPVVISVPHAGRDYGKIEHQLRVPLRAVEALEDRYADLLVADVIAAGTPTIISRTPRLVIDLNRNVDDLDRAMVRGLPPSGKPLNAKVRGGLGLIPSRLAGTGPLWREPIAAEAVSDRITNHYDVYHATLAAMMHSAAATFGTAFLIDIHSMPSLTGDGDPDFVIGDRFGQTAGDDLVQTIAAIATGHGRAVALNTPYAGGHIITRHAAPAKRHFAVQIEIDRKLYLDATRRNPGPGLAAIQGMLADIAGAIGVELHGPQAIAAE